MTRALLRVAILAATALARVSAARADDALDANDAQATTVAAAEPSAWSLRLSADLGVGVRSFSVPMNGVVYQTDTGPFPLAGVGFELDRHASRDVSLGLLLRYQSSVGLGIVEQHTDGSERPLDARANRIELGLTPTFRFDAEGRWALCLAAGYGILGFRPVGHLVTPGFSLDGPHLRVQLQVPLLSDVLRLRVGPEAQWLSHVGSELVERGVASHGFALGGEAGLELALSQRFMLHAVYRETHAFVDSSQAQSFEDTARFVTARFSGKL